MKYLTFLALTLSDWALTKACLSVGCIEGNPVVGWVGGIDNGLILKIVCWALVVVLVPVSNNAWPNMGNKMLMVAILFYSGIVLWNTYMLVGPVL